MTKEELQDGIQEGLKTFAKDFRGDLAKSLSNHKEGIREEMKANTRDIISHFNASQSLQNEKLEAMNKTIGEMNEKLEEVGDDVAKVKLAVVDLLGTERCLHNLVDELQRNGVAIDKQRVFAR